MATGGDEQDIVSEESVDINCVICARKDRVKPAYKYCLDCKTSLCTACVEYHNDFTEGHRLGETGNNGEEEGLWTEKCPKHKTKLPHIYCIDHDKLVCGVCFLMEHKNCRKENLTTSAIESKDLMVQGIKEQLESTLQKVDQVIGTLDSHTDIWKECELQLLHDIDVYTKRLVSRIEELKENAEKEVTNEYQKLASGIKEARETFVTNRADINRLIDAVNAEPEDHFDYLVKRGEILTRHVDALCRDSKSLIKSQSAMFKLDSRLDVLSDFTSLVTEAETYNASMAGYFNVKIPDDGNPCSITGCCVLPDGSVLLVDSNNKTLKLFDPTAGKVTNQLSVNDEIKAIARTSQHEVAVCLSKIQMYSFDKQIRYTKTLNTSSWYRVAYCNGEMYVSTQTSIYVYDMAGTRISVISEQFFPNIRGIAVNHVGDRLFVMDEQKGLVSMDRSGKQIFTRSPTELGITKPHGVCSDEAGQFFVCGYSSNNVVQVSDKGHVIGQILREEDGIVSPQCLCYDARRHKLYVAGATAKLKMYRLG